MRACHAGVPSALSFKGIMQESLPVKAQLTARKVKETGLSAKTRHM
jgi:hypothetical protein